MLKTIQKFFKKSETNKLLVQFHQGQPIYTPIDFEELAKEGYKKNVYVYRAVNIIANTVAGIPWKCFKKTTGDMDIELETHPVLDLINRPNPMMGKADFFIALVSYLEVEGNSYVERVGPDRGPPRELFILRPDRMRVIGGDSIDPIGGYEYTVNAITHRFTPEEIFHMKLFNPLNDWYGMAPIVAAARTIDQSNSSKDWNLFLLQNSANPSGVLTSESPLTDDQFNRLKKELEEKYQGSKNAGRPFLLEGGLDWKKVGLSPVDMQWLEGSKMAAKEIAIAFGVPSELLGDAESKTFSNYEQAVKSFYTETILPLMDMIRDDFLNNWLVPMFGNDIYLEYDLNHVEALNEERSIIWDRNLEAFEKGLITRNEAREALGFSELTEEETQEEPDEFEEEESKKKKKSKLSISKHKTNFSPIQLKSKD